MKYKKMCAWVLTLALAFCSLSAGSITIKADDEKVIKTSLYWDYFDLDPAIFAHKQPNAIVTSIYENLVTYDENMTLQPMLAENWEISEDGLEYIFHLRQGVQFHRGYGEMKASDVVFTFQRMKDLGDASTAGKMMGVGNFTVEALDDYTVKFTLTQADPSLMTHLALWCGFIVSEAAVTDLGDAFDTTPIGTGPFELVSVTYQDSAETQRFEDYWGEPADIDRVITYYLTDEDTMYTAFDSGELNMISSENANKTNDYAQKEEYRITEGMSNQILGFGLNMEREPLQDIKVREAIFHAINMDDMCEGYFEGTQSKTSYIIPESAAYAKEGVFDCPYDPELSKQLLAEAGYENGLDLELVTYNDNRQNEAVVLQAYLQQVGINLTVTPLEMAAFNDRTGSGDFDLWYCGWTVNITPDDFLVRAFRSDGIFNYGRYNDPEYDAKLDAAVNEIDQEKKAELYGEVQDYIAAQYLYYPMFTLKRSIVMPANISGNPFNPLTYPFNFYGLKME